jgi:WD40 repeat protein
MGTVFLAEQEEPVRRRVAVKLIKAGMDSRQVLARFEAERQALALMDHPNITKVFDAGTTPTGRPYFVMELVKGVPITTYCDQQHLTPRERLELFLPVCSAVQHAHQKGVIHRDLKPSNVLVALQDGRPVPKVIDFGVAKALHQRLAERTLFTEVGQVVGTLEYMAPEQAELNNLDIDTRADVYSLGVLLYELLTGSPPFTAKQLRGAAFTEMLRLIREVEPPKPSTKLSSSEDLPRIAADRKQEPAKLPQLVRGELDWIVMKALEKDRNRRYATANGLAADVQRYLAGEPVQAVPPSAGYRLRKFLRRNKGPVAAVGLLLLALVGGIIGTAWQAVRAERARQAEAERAEGEGKARKDAVEAGEQLRVARDELWSNLYAARANLIQNAWEANTFGRVRELLAEQVPKAGERDLRHFEWHYFDRPVHAELRLNSLEKFNGFGRLSPDGSRLVGWLRRDPNANGKQGDRIGVWDAATGQLHVVFEAHTAEEAKRFMFLIAFEYSPDGSMISLPVMEASDTGGTPGFVTYFWETATGKRLHRAPAPGPNASLVTLTDDRKRLLWWAVDTRKGVKPTLHARDLGSGKDLYSLDLPADDVEGFSLSRDGTSMAAALVFGKEPAAQSEVWVWSVADGKKRLSTGRLEGKAASVAFSPDGGRVVVGFRSLPGKPHQLTVWDAATGKEVFGVLTAAGFSPVFSPDGRLLAARSGAVIEVRDAATGRLRQALRGHTGMIWDHAFNADGSRLHSCGADGVVRVWDAHHVENAEPVPVPGEIHLLFAVSRDGSRFVGKMAGTNSKPGTTTDTLAVWDRTGRRLATLEATLQHEGRTVLFDYADLDREGRRVAFAHMKDVSDQGRSRPEGQLLVWDVATGKPLLARTEWGGFYGCALSPDGSRVASVFQPEGRPAPTLFVWDVETGRELRRFDLPAGSLDTVVAFSPDSGRLVLDQHGSPGDGTDVLTSWDLGAGNKLWEVATPGIGQRPRLLVHSPDGRRIARSFSGYSDPGVVEVVDGDTGKRVCTLRGHADVVEYLRFSPDGRRVATSTRLGELRVWDVESGRALLDLKRAESRSLTVLTFTPDGHRLAALMGDGKNSAIVEWDGTPRAVDHRSK